MITSIGFKIGLDIILFCVFYFGVHLLVFGGIKQFGKGFLIIREDRRIRIEVVYLLLLIYLAYVLVNVIAIISSLNDFFDPSSDVNIEFEIFTQLLTPLIALIFWFFVLSLIGLSGNNEKKEVRKIVKIVHKKSLSKRISHGIIFLFIGFIFHAYFYSKEDSFALGALISPGPLLVFIIGSGAGILIRLFLKRKKSKRRRRSGGPTFIFSFLFVYSLVAILIGFFLLIKTGDDSSKFGYWMAYILLLAVYCSLAFIVLWIARLCSFLKSMGYVEVEGKQAEESEKSISISVWQKFIVPLTTVCYLGIIAVSFYLLLQK